MRFPSLTTVLPLVSTLRLKPTKSTLISTLLQLHPPPLSPVPPARERPNATSVLAASTREAKNAVPPMAHLVRPVTRVPPEPLETLVTLANRVILAPKVTRELMAT